MSAKRATAASKRTSSPKKATGATAQAKAKAAAKPKVASKAKTTSAPKAKRKPKAKVKAKSEATSTAATAKATKAKSGSARKGGVAKQPKAKKSTSSPAASTEKGRTRTSTSTSNFGVGRREGHDSSGFYQRFTAPQLSDDNKVITPLATDTIWVGDARDMDAHGKVADNSVALVVTSPPYFAGKAYEEDLGNNGIPANYLEYLEMLEAVFSECVRKLEPGGRIAVNVANLGRKPYRSLSADIIGIFERLGLLLRGEVIWRKAETPGGSCAWGSFQRPANPVLRDTTERVIIASKGRFDRAVSPADRVAQDLPAKGSILADEFLEATSDVWDIPPESARRVGHPAPFPVELPRRLIELFTYVDDLVLDPFMGAGSTAIAAALHDRRFIGFDTDPAYVELANGRVTDALAQAAIDGPVATIVPATKDHHPSELETPLDFPFNAIQKGRKATDIALEALERAGFVDIVRKARVAGTEVTFKAVDQLGNDWLFEVSGTLTASRPGQLRTDLLLKSLSKALIIAGEVDKPNLMLLTTHRPKPRSPGGKALAGALHANVVSATIELLDHNDLEVLGRAAEFGPDSLGD